MGLPHPSETKDWARARKGQLVGWGLPAAAMVAAGVLGAEAGVWPVALLWMGAACLANARRCGRRHCLFTGPFLLVMATLALLLGLEIVTLGGHGWAWVGGGTLAGATLLTYFPERLWGSYIRRD